MSNFGDLPYGEIPEPLKFVYPFQMTQLSNGIRVCTEKSKNALYSSVNVTVKAGSRDEDLETSGSAYLLSRMVERGNGNRTKAEIQSEYKRLGQSYESEIDRE